MHVKLTVIVTVRAGVGQKLRSIRRPVSGERWADGDVGTRMESCSSESRQTLYQLRQSIRLSSTAM